jgi:hypothetical protein
MGRWVRVAVAFVLSALGACGQAGADAAIPRPIAPGNGAAIASPGSPFNAVIHYAWRSSALHDHVAVYAVKRDGSLSADERAAAPAAHWMPDDSFVQVGDLRGKTLGSHQYRPGKYEWRVISDGIKGPLRSFTVVETGIRRLQVHIRVQSGRAFITFSNNAYEDMDLTIWFLGRQVFHDKANLRDGPYQTETRVFRPTCGASGRYDYRVREWAGTGHRFSNRGSFNLTANSCIPRPPPSSTWPQCSDAYWGGGAFNLSVYRLTCQEGARISEGGFRPHSLTTRVGGFRCRRQRNAENLVWVYTCSRYTGEGVLFDTY